MSKHGSSHEAGTDRDRPGQTATFVPVGLAPIPGQTGTCVYGHVSVCPDADPMSRPKPRLNRKKPNEPQNTSLPSLSGWWKAGVLAGQR
jgi:hypothetical protein